MKSKKPLIRRTFLQERFDILMKKQRTGKLTFNDLTELDFIVNRDPAIRESILEEMHSSDTPYDDPPQPFIPSKKKDDLKPGIKDKLKHFLGRLFITTTRNLSTV